MKEITTVGIDLAKEVFAICMLDARGAVLERKVLRRAAFERWAAALPASTVAMEACGSAHHWGRYFAARGHTARLIAAEFVVAFRQGGKNDGNDALAIAVAARQPTMRFVPIKTVEQQAILSWHRARAGFNDERTALINRLRGLLAEFGITLAQSSDRLLKALPGLSSDERVPLSLRALLLEAREQLAALHARLERCDCEIAAHARDSIAARRVREVLGVGVLTASAFAATIPDPTVFRHGRQLGAWLGLTPRQASSGGKTRLGDSSRRGDAYLRTLLVQGARSALQVALKTARKGNPLAALDQRAVCAQGLSQDVDCDCQQARAHPVGDAGARPALRPEGVATASAGGSLDGDVFHRGDGCHRLTQPDSSTAPRHNLQRSDRTWEHPG